MLSACGGSTQHKTDDLWSQYMLAEMSKNAVGSIANDFEFLTRSDAGTGVSSLESMRGKNILLLFYRPGCDHCKACIDSLKASEELERLIGQESVTVIAVDTDGDKSNWDTCNIIPKTWVNAIIAQESFIEENTYAIMSYPAMYLIGPGGHVLLKDETNTESAVSAALSASVN